MVVYKGHQAIPSVRIVGSQCIPAIADKTRGLPLNKNIVDGEIKGICENRVERVAAPGLGAGIASALAVRSVQHLAEEEEVWLSRCFGPGPDGGWPSLPESHLDMLDCIDTEGIEAQLLNEPGVRIHQGGTNLWGICSQVVQAIEFTQDLFRILVVTNPAEVVQPIQPVEGRRRLDAVALPLQHVVGGRMVFRPPGREAGGEVGQVIDDYISDDSDSRIVGGGDQ